MKKLIIWAVFDIKPGAFAAFQEAIIPNARAAVRDEPGCRQFDILTAEDGSQDQVTLYEIYDDAAAFDTHLETPHFAKFKEVLPDLTTGSNVTKYFLVE